MEWIKCADRIPELEETVLLENYVIAYRMKMKGDFWKEGWAWADSRDENTFWRPIDIKYWMPLPEPPTEEAKGE